MEATTVIKVGYYKCTTASSQNYGSKQKMLNEIREATNLGQIIIVRVFSCL